MKKRTRKLLSLLLCCLMLVGILSMGQVAYAAGITDASNVNVNNHSFYDPGRLYYTNGASDTGNLADNPNWNAHYDPATGVLELKNYNGGEIYAGGLKATDLTIKLTGNNTVTATGQMGVSHIYGGNIIITSDSSGSLTINISSSTTDVNGISAGHASSFTTGNVTISGNANVTVNATATSTDYGKWANGIYAKERVSILDNASYAAVCKSATQSSGAQAGSGICAQGGGVTLNTSGTVNIDASQAGVSGQGIYSGGGTNQATKVSSMTIKYKKDGLNGVPIYPQNMFDSVAENYAINISNTDCVATYRYGTPYTVTVSRGKCDASGNSTGQYLANDTVTITASTLSSGLTFKKWVSDDVTLSNPNNSSTTFTMPVKNVKVTADYNAFAVQPSFTATNAEKGDITFTLAAETTDAPILVTKDGDESDVVGGQYFYGSGTSRTATIYNGTGTYQVPAGEYRVAARFDGHWFFSDPFEVSYTPSVKTLDSIAITTPPTKTTYTAGESFDKAGMVVTATYDDSTTAPVTSYTVSPSGALATTDTSVTVSYTEGGVTKTAAQAITVNAASTPTAPTITTSTLPNGKVGTAYEQTLAATGDTPITWTLESGGSLPAGLTLGTDGKISGTPTTAGDYTFTVKATNGAGSDTKSYTVTITSPLGIAIDATNFPDANFRTFVKTYDTDSNDYLSEAELAAVTEMDCTNKEIADLTGIEHFTALTRLNCYNNQLTTLDVNNNTALTELYCYNNQLTSLDVSKNTALTYLWCYTNKLTTLDVSKNTNLKWLDCYGNNLTTLDVSAVPALKDAKENGTYTPGSVYDVYSSMQGALRVDKTVNIITEHYTISFAANGGTGTMADVTGISGEYTLPENGFTAPDGKQFKAWSVGGVEKAAGDTITVNANTTVTAIWEDIPAGHTHSYGSEWKSDADKHWHECSCGAKAEEAAHTASNWILDTPATAATDGTKHKECTECGYVMETGTIPATGGGEHTHSYSSDWKSDSINHWHECSCGVKDDVAAHSFKWVIDKEATATKKGSKHEECKFCGYQRPAVEIPATGSTTKPTDPTESNPNTGALDDVPQTGDNSNMILWIVLLLASGLGVTGTVVYSKRKKYAK